MSTAPASAGSPCSSGKSFSTVCIALRSKNSAADSMPVPFISVMASQADLVVGKSSSADAENGVMSAVLTVIEERNAKVPSEPTMRWAMMSNGSSYSTKGRIVNPVTFLMLYLRLMRSVSAMFFRVCWRSSSILRKNAGWLMANAARLFSSPVSSSVPSGRMIRTDCNTR